MHLDRCHLAVLEAQLSVVFGCLESEVGCGSLVEADLDHS